MKRGAQHPVARRGLAVATAATALLLCGASTQSGGCSDDPERAPQGHVADTPAPSATPEPTPAPEPSPASLQPPPPLALPLDAEAPLRDGWAVIVEKSNAAERAWVEAGIYGGDRLTIRTHNVSQFDLHLPRLHLDWEKKIVLRMDDFNSQLTRKRWPVIHFQRTSAGAWVAMDKKQD